MARLATGWGTRYPKESSAREYERADIQEVEAQIKEMHDAAREEVWASYRFIALGDRQEKRGLRIIDLGAGHSSASETLCGRIIAALKAEALLNENVGAGYIERHWPPAFKDSGVWPLTSLRQSFLNGALTRLIDPDAVLRRQVVEFRRARRLRPGIRYRGRW